MKGDTSLALIGGSLLLLGMLQPQARSQGVTSVCARVKIEISQDITLNRQAFEARLRIGNTLPVALSNVVVSLSFRDEEDDAVLVTSNPNNSDPGVAFFVRVDGDHPDSVAVAGEETLTWTIIPTLVAADLNADNGTPYFVGATLTYTANGEDESVIIAPDLIRVKPLPEFELHYFIPAEVESDNPFTPIREPAVPFSLGLRITNVGAPSSDFAVDSGQPQIVSDEGGTGLQFRILGTHVNDIARSPTLRTQVGEIGTDERVMVRWDMATEVSGRFISFTALVSHADELGGAVTALIPNAPVTHLLVRPVINDLPGRDGIVDFLAWSGTDPQLDELVVYESDRGALDVVLPAENRLIDSHSLSQSGSNYQVTLSSLAAISPFYLRTIDPTGGALPVERVVRSDGKILNRENVWQTSYLPPAGGGTPEPVHEFHLFDVNAQSQVASFTYTITFGEGGANRAPVLGLLADQVIVADEAFTLPVIASDPDGTTPALGLALRPFGSNFADNLNGSGQFSWTPTLSQVGDYPLTFVASDGQLTTSRSITISVVESGIDSIEAWKSLHGLEGIANSSDADADGFSLLYEFALGMDPAQSSVHQKPVVGKTEIGGNYYLTFTFTQRSDPAGLGLTYSVLGAGRTDVPSYQWITLSQQGSVSQDDVANGFQRVQLIDDVALEDSASGRYLRLRVILEAPR